MAPALFYFVLRKWGPATIVRNPLFATWKAGKSFTYWRIAVLFMFVVSNVEADGHKPYLWGSHKSKHQWALVN